VKILLDIIGDIENNKDDYNDDDDDDDVHAE